MKQMNETQQISYFRGLELFHQKTKMWNSLEQTFIRVKEL